MFFFYSFSGVFSNVNVCIAATLEVGSGKRFSTIQAAVNYSGSGDTILVYDGIYREEIVVTKSNITLQGL